MILTMLVSLTLGPATHTFAVDCPEHQEAPQESTPLAKSPVMDDRSHTIMWWVLGGLGVVMIGAFGWHQWHWSSNRVSLPAVPEPLIPQTAIPVYRPNKQWCRINSMSHHHSFRTRSQRSSRSKQLRRKPAHHISSVLG